MGSRCLLHCRVVAVVAVVMTVMPSPRPAYANRNLTTGLWNWANGDGYSAMYPTWSPDGRVAFAVQKDWQNQPYPSPDLWLTTIAGGLTQLSRIGNLDQPNWAPMSGDIACIAPVHERDPAIFSLGGALKTFALPGAAGSSAPTWAPDGSLLAYSGGDNGVYVFDPNGANIRRLTTGDSPSFSPLIGDRVLFQRKSAGLYQLFTANLDGSHERAITDSSDNAQSASWLSITCFSPPPDSPDPDQPFGPICSDQISDPLQIIPSAVIAYECNGSICIISDVGTGRSVLPNETGTPLAAPLWSPDGSRLAFLAGNSLMVADPDGTHVQVWANDVASGTPKSGLYAWSPDASSIAYVCMVNLWVNGAWVPRPNICLASGPLGNPPPQSCDPSNCNGCCDGVVCQMGMTNTACGSAGLPCAVCSGGDNCSGTPPACLSAPGGGLCGPGNCNGCCLNNVCYMGLTNDACGSAGLECSVCGTGQQCGGTPPACMSVPGADTCSPANCNGCCLNNKCELGRANAACGFSGLDCLICVGEQCSGTPPTCALPPGGTTCGPANCTGCCLNDKCQSGRTNAACGQAGLACDVCSSGEQCTGTPPICATTAATGGCGPGNCNGCCSNNKCYSGTSNATCGNSGLQCLTCGTGQTCGGTPPTCVTSSSGIGICNSSNCMTGCCDGSGTCRKPSDAFCGTMAQNCTPCYGSKCDPTLHWCQ